MTVSILIPTFNASSYIEETLLSCIRQGKEVTKEIIIVDDNSDDKTAEIVRHFAKSHPRTNIIIEANEGIGACAARNHAFSLATGEAIQWLDADDLLGPNKLSTQIELLKTHPNHLINCKWRRFSGDLDNLYPEERGNWDEVPNVSTPLEWLASERMVALHSWLGTRALFEKIGPWHETLLINQDGEYFTRAVAASEGVVFEPESRVYYRSGVQGSVSQFNPEKAPSLFRSCESFERVALTLGNKEDVGTLISNKYQGFIYRVYPFVPELRKAAEQKIQQFGKPTRGSDIAESILAKLICATFGWRALVQMRLLRSKLLG